MDRDSYLGGGSDPQRLFVALWPGPGLQQRLAQLGRQAVDAAGGRATRQESIHLTLVFLGNVDTAQRDALEARLDTVRAIPFTIALDRLGSFGSGIVWAGSSKPSEPLDRLQAAVAAAAENTGIVLEARPFKLHVTLARRARRRVRGVIEPLDWRVDAFRLVRSEEGSAGSRYSCLREWRFAAGDGESSPRAPSRRSPGDR